MVSRGGIMKHTRRQFLQLSAIAAAGVVLAACQPTSVPATAVPKGGATSAPGGTTFKGTLELYPQFYYPSTDMTWSENNPLPHHMSQVLADEYKANHPDVTISLVNHPSSVADHEWIITGQAGGTIPHIVWTHRFWVDTETDKNWWVPLDPYFAEPDPYITAGQPGSAKWQDVFFDIPFGTTPCPDGKHYIVPLDLVTTFFFYNKDMYAKAGITAAPQTWSEYMAALKALKDAGMIPLANLGWYTAQIGDMIYKKKYPQVAPGGGVVSMNQVACAIQNGVYRPTNPEYKLWMEYTKGIIPYLAPDWAASGTDFAKKFNNQEAATFEDGTWRFGYLRANPLLKFQWSTFYAPAIQPSDTPYATGVKAIPVGGPSAAQWAVSTRAQKDNLLPLAVDVLRWYSAPQNGGRMIGECGAFLPCIKGTDVNPDLAEPLKAITSGLGEASMFTYGDKYSTETGDLIAPIWQDYELGVITEDDAVAKLDKIFADYATAAIAKNSWKCA
jgi:raffinose/stachyose/melibiose transport system substrate-binding protein